MLGRTETQTRDRMYCQTIRTVRDISRDDRARIATCSLRTPTDLRRIIVQIARAAEQSLVMIYTCVYHWRIYNIHEICLNLDNIT